MSGVSRRCRPCSHPIAKASHAIGAMQSADSDSTGTTRARTAIRIHDDRHGLWTKLRRSKAPARGCDAAFGMPRPMLSFSTALWNRKDKRFAAEDPNVNDPSGYRAPAWVLIRSSWTRIAC